MVSKFKRGKEKMEPEIVDILNNMEKESIRIKILENDEVMEIEKGTRFTDIFEKFQAYHDAPIVAVRHNNSIRELTSVVEEDGIVRFIDLKELDGIRIYQRSLIFLLYVAGRRLFPKSRLVVFHSLGKGLYCEFKGMEMDEEKIRKLKEEMMKLVREDHPIEKREFDKKTASNYFRALDEYDKVELLKFRKKRRVKLYKLLGYYNYFYGYIVHRTGILGTFDLKKHHNGFVILHPDPNDPTKPGEYSEMPMLSSVFLEYERWGEILGVKNVGDINNMIIRNKVRDLIMVAEALHEKKIAEIASKFMESGARLILIAGPSSSGKTTFAKRLSLQLRANGLNPVAISLDDYFVDKEKTPRDEDGNYDFDSIYALDLKLFNEHLLKLLDGKEIELPKYDFRRGKKVWTGRKLRIEKDQPLIVEGIHGLNELLTKSIPRDMKFKIYVSALTQLNIDSLNRISTTDTRIIRRMVRDSKFRGYSALETLRMWRNVRRGEEKYIFPFQEEADAMFNSALVYELAVLKIFAEPLLIQVNSSNPEYSEATRLLKFIDFFLPITSLEDIPRNSILREFIGGSIFKY